MKFPVSQSAVVFALAICLAAAAPAKAEPVPLEGGWRGSGSMVQMDNPPQKLTCKINYKRDSAKLFKLAAKCVTISASVNLTGELLKVNSGVYVGDFHVPAYDVSGRARVVVEGSAQTMTFKSSRVSGTVSLTK